MKNYYILCDVSLDPKLKIGVGAYLIVTDKDIELFTILDKNLYTSKIKYHFFKDISSTKLEMQTAIWALNEIKSSSLYSADDNYILGTDSQCIAGLLNRKSKNENLNFASSTGRPLNLAYEYSEFYKLYDEMGFEIQKIKGHSPGKLRDNLEKLFTLVDKFSRKKFKEIKNDISI